MTERTPATPPSWELAPIRDALAADWDSRSDPVLGDGVVYQLPGSTRAEFTCYPEAGVVRLSTPELHVALTQQEPPVLDDRGVVFSRETENGRTDMTVDQDGSVTLMLTPAGLEIASGAAERPADASSSPDEGNYT